MKKVIIALALVLSICHIAEAKAYTMPQLSCGADTVGTPPTSFVLYRKQPGETAYTVVVEQATCAFTNVTIPDTGESCFYFSTKNAAGEQKRIWTTICTDPTKLPPAAPVGVGVK